MMDALDGAGWCTPFFSVIFAFHVRMSIFEQWDAERAALLRTPVDHAEFVYVEIPCLGTATPFIFLTFD